MALEPGDRHDLAMRLDRMLTLVFGHTPVGTTLDVKEFEDVTGPALEFALTRGTDEARVIRDPSILAMEGDAFERMAETIGQDLRAILDKAPRRKKKR